MSTRPHAFHLMDGSLNVADLYEVGESELKELGYSRIQLENPSSKSSATVGFSVVRRE